MSTEPVNPSTGLKKALSGIDTILFTICAILVLDTLATTASIGPSTLSLLVITLIFFLLPYGMITAELSAAYPEQGGIYAWVRRGLGESWAGRTSWFYWVNNAIWMPSVFLVFSSILSQLFFPGLGLWPQIAIAVFMSWLTVVLGILPLQQGKIVPNVGALIKLVLIAVIGVAGILFGLRNGMANDLSFTNILPTWDSGLAFMPIIIFNLIGFELISSAGAQVHRPERSIPRAILVSGIVVSLFYLISNVGLLMAIPVDQLGVLEGIIDSLRIIFGETGTGNTIVTVIGIGILLTFLANMVVWMMGTTRTIAEAAVRGDLPSFFGKTHPRNKTPLTACILTGVVSTISVVIYGFLAGGNAQQLFLTLFELSSIALLIPYIFLFLAFVELRRIDPNTPRPYKVPVNYGGAALLAALCILFILQALVFFVWTPGTPIDWNYAAPILIGIGVLVLIGELLLRSAQQKKLR